VCGAYEVAVASGIHSFFLTINIAAFPSTKQKASLENLANPATRKGSA